VLSGCGGGGGGANEASGSGSSGGGSSSGSSSGGTSLGGNAAFAVGGTVSGLASGASVTLNDNGGDPVTVSVNGNFTFPTALAAGSSYDASVATQPNGETCTVSNASGRVGSGAVTSISVTCSPPNTSTGRILQSAQYNGYPGANSTAWKVTLNNVQAGSTIYVVGTWPNIANTYPSMNVTDGTNTYTLLDRYDDTPSGHWQSLGHWYAANVPAGSYTINMTPTPTTWEDYVGIAVFEIGGVSAAPLVAHALNFQSKLPPGSNTVKVNLTNSASSGLLVAVSMDDYGSVAPAAPLVGNGFTDAGSLWDFLRVGNPSTRAEYALVSSTGAQTATFSPQESTNSAGLTGVPPDYITCAVIFH